jgi:hypothetical protein
MGNAPEVPGAMNAMAADLLSDGVTPDQLDAALQRCRRECVYPVRLPHIFQRVPGRETPAPDAEMRRAWDELVRFTEKYVGMDSISGVYHPKFGFHGPRVNAWTGEIKKPATYPRLSQRILDCVRRTGGWAAYACMDEDDFPHQQRRFFDEYLAWLAVEKVEPAKLVGAPPTPQLSGKVEGDEATDEDRYQLRCELARICGKPMPKRGEAKRGEGGPVRVGGLL